MTLTAEDYKRQEERKKARRGNFQITVPQPFSFDREKMRSKSIRELKLEELVVEKQLQEEALLKHRFKPKPVPPEVSSLRYRKILEKNEKRKAKVKRESVERTRALENPFKFYLRDKEKQKPNPDEE